MEKIKGTLEMQLELEKEDKHLAETLMKATYEKAIKESKGSETNVGIRMMEHVFTTCSENVEKVLFPTKKCGVVPYVSRRCKRSYRSVQGAKRRPHSHEHPCSPEHFTQWCLTE